MLVIQGLQNAGVDLGVTALTIGNFDGLHLGHRMLVQAVKRLSHEKKVQGGLMTFEPHPLKVLFPEKQTKMIFGLDDRIREAETLGLDFFIVEPFSRELSELEPEVFFKTLVVEKLKCKFLVVGHDFTFGKNRSGTLEILKSLCAQYGVQLEVLAPFKLNGEIVSSTAIRKAIADGEPEKAGRFLGRPFFLKGVVERGAARGRQLGFPTANLYTDSELFPKSGVYVTFFEVKGVSYKSVTNVGTNPTFQEKTKRPIQVESYILNFDQDIYGEQVKVSFLKYLRPELKFGSVEELISQIKLDVKATENFSWSKN